MQLIIHRGAHQVGGSCVELAYEDTHILIDVGLPLEFDFSDDPKSHLPQPLFEELRNGNKKIDAVILSHAHLDHYGLASALPPGVPAYCGEASSELMVITGQMSPEKAQPIKLKFFKAWKEFQVGAFSVTPYLMDHSAFDAYGFLISAGGKSLFYTGDFRGHGRKAKLLDRLVKNPPKTNALLMEGTLVGKRTNELTITESDLEKEFVQVIKKTPGIVLVTTSSQNIDRIVTIFKATKRTGRRFIIDFYTAEILDRLTQYAKLEDLKKLVDAVAPEMVIPIHSFHPDKFKDYFPNVRLVDDGEVVNL